MLKKIRIWIRIEWHHYALSADNLPAKSKRVDVDDLSNYAAITRPCRRYGGTHAAQGVGPMINEVLNGSSLQKKVE